MSDERPPIHSHFPRAGEVTDFCGDETPQGRKWERGLSVQRPEPVPGERILALMLPVSVTLLARLGDCLTAFRPDDDLVISTDPEVPGTIEIRAVPRA